MAEIGDEKTGGSDNPYAIDFGNPLNPNDGDEGSGEGSDRQIPIVDPLAGTDDRGNDAENRNTGSTSGDGASETGRRKRGRPKGSRNSADKAVHLGGWEDAVLAIHLALAGIAKCPELELDEGEAKKVTMALDKLAAHYDVAPSETAKVWMNFAGAIGSVYGPRAIAIKHRLDAEKGTKKTPDNVSFLNQRL